MMNNTSLPSGWQLQSHISADGLLTLRLLELPTPAPGPDEVVLRVQAAPINPSDIGLLLGAADLGSLQLQGQGAGAVLSAQVPAAAMPAMAGRIGQALPVGNEGAGEVIAAGESPAAQALLGRRVAALGGAMFAQYRTVKLDQCLVLPEGATAADGASSFVNPLTALGMVETMRREGHTALVHTAAASNLGQMLNRICLQDGIALVNIVRSAAQVTLLREAGAVHVCDSSAPDFVEQLTQALVSTGATLGFDAIGGGPLAGQILNAMEVALNRSAGEYSRYGSPVHKQVYIYGGLDTSPTLLPRRFGMHWGLGGWLLFPFLQRLAPQQVQALKQRVADELHSTFASHYEQTISLSQMLEPARVTAYAKRATGAKTLVDPSLG
jgi:NADPH:quinone reductase